MGRVLSLCVLLIIAELQQGCSYQGSAFVEIPVTAEQRDGFTEEVVCYVKRADLCDTGVTEEEVRQCLLAMFDTLDDALATMIWDILPDPPDQAAQSAKRELEGTRGTKRTFDRAKIEPLLARGVFVEFRRIRGKEVTIVRRDVLRFSKDR